MNRETSLSIKHCLDRFISAQLLVGFVPLMVSIAAAIKLEDGGPALFRQERLGLRGKTFDVWKFRTMFVNADKLLNEDGTVSVNRITRVGKVLRFLSLDELPQLVNILKGEMSIVGPRPALVSHYDRYTETQKMRLEMKPGITGLAQVNGRNTLPWSKRIEYDIQYIEQFSLLSDIRILLKTIKITLFREGIVADRNSESVDDLRRPG